MADPQKYRHAFRLPELHGDKTLYLPVTYPVLGFQFYRQNADRGEGLNESV